MEESVPDVYLAAGYNSNVTENSPTKKQHPLKK
jgi:hypothetical protein